MQQSSGWQTFSVVLFLDIILVKNYNFPVVLRLISGTVVRNGSQTLRCFVIDFLISREFRVSAANNPLILKHARVSSRTVFLSSLSHFRLPESDCFGAKMIVLSLVFSPRCHWPRVRKMSWSMWIVSDANLHKTATIYQMPHFNLTLKPAQPRVIVLSFDRPRLSFHQDLRNISNGQLLWCSSLWFFRGLHIIHVVLCCSSV